MTNKTQITTVGSLKKALADLPDDQLIMCQVSADDGRAWYLRGDFVDRMMDGTVSLIDFSHPTLKTLPMLD